MSVTREQAQAAAQRAKAKKQQHGNANGAAGDPWQEPIPLYAEHQRAAPYPIDALPPIIRNAVQSYQSFGRQPVELVACSALATISLACQALADVDRDGNLAGPCSLSFLTVGVSGERKSAADKRMRRALADWERETFEEQAPQIKAARRKLANWEARRDGMANKIKRLAGSTKEQDEVELQQLESKLLLHESEEPKVPPEVALFHEETSPEQLAIRLAIGWPSSSLWSDEAGLVIGSHAMTEGVAMRFLALLNRLWDGGDFKRERVTRESVHLRGRRFSCSLMMQPYVLATLLRTGDGLARGVGTIARFLVAWPTSTMGTRDYCPGNLNSPALQAFDARLRELMDCPLPLGNKGALEPPKLRLSQEAFQTWRSFHDDVEHELGTRGEFSEVPDIGAKIAEQAARLACCFHVFQHGPHDQIDATTMRAGAQVAAWHLHEANRILSFIGYSGETSDAQILLDWLLERTEPTTPRDVLRLGPYRLREKARRDSAVAILTENFLARIETVERSEILVPNPGLRK